MEKSETGDVCCRQQGWRAMANDTLWKRDGSIMSPRCQTQSCRIWCLPYAVLVLLWSDLSFLCLHFSLFTQECVFYANVYRKYAVCSLILQGSQLSEETLDFWAVLRLLNTTGTFGVRVKHFSSKDGWDPMRNISIGSYVWTPGSGLQLA